MRYVGVLKFVLVIRGIKKYQSILGYHMPQPNIGQILVFVNITNMRLLPVNTTYVTAVSN